MAQKIRQGSARLRKLGVEHTSVSAGSRVNVPGGALGEGEFPADRLGDSCGGDSVACSPQERVRIPKNGDYSLGNQFLIAIRTKKKLKTGLFQLLSLNPSLLLGT